MHPTTWSATDSRETDEGVLGRLYQASGARGADVLLVLAAVAGALEILEAKVSA